MAAKDPLRQLMEMADQVRSNVDSMVSEGTKGIRGALPELPFPGEGKTRSPLAAPEDILARLPKLPRLPGMAEEKAAPTPVAPRPTPTPRPTGLGIPGGYQLRDAFHPSGYQLRT